MSSSFLSSELWTTLNENQRSLVNKQFDGLSRTKKPLLREIIQGQDFALNSDQLEGLLHDHDEDGPLLILAGAGSGKTAVMTRRIVYLYLKGYSLEEVLAVTFTNKAAREMRDRVEEILRFLWSKTEHNELKTQFEELIRQLDKAWLGTFHSLGRRILELNHPDRNKPLIKLIRNTYNTPIHLLDPDDQWQLLETIFYTNIPDHEEYDLHAVFDRIQEWRRNMIGLRQAQEEANNDFENTAALLYKKYQRRKRQQRPAKLDFQDLLVFPTRLMRENKSIRSFLQTKFQHVLIDEFQDTNPVQYILTKQIADEHGRLFAVGDDAQSIYGWRGADIRNIQKFESSFPGSTVLRLEKNYRSNANIVMSANDVFKDDEHVYNKELSPSKGNESGLDYGKEVAVFECLSDREERGLLGYEIERLVQNRGYNYGDIAVFYRINQQKKSIKRYFEEQNISHVELGETNFFELPAVHYIRCFFRILEGMFYGRTDRKLENIDSYGEALREWWSRPNANYNASVLNQADTRRQIFNILIDENKRGEFRESLSTANRSTFDEDISRFEETYEALWDGAEMIKIYNKLTDELSFENSNNQSELTDNVRTLCGDWIENTQEKTGPPGLEIFLESVKEQTRDPQFVPGDPSKFVQMTTLHGAKGLEFPVVFFIGLEEEVCPYKHPNQDDWDQNRLNEEKRLFYVGLTRAEQRLNLTWCRQRKWFGNVQIQEKSRFLKLLPDDLKVDCEPPRSLTQRVASLFIR